MGKAAFGTSQQRGKRRLGVGCSGTGRGQFWLETGGKECIFLCVCKVLRQCI